MRKIALLGSTGSIGTQALDVAARHADRFQIIALTAHSSAEKLFAQARQFHPKLCGLVVEPESIPDDLRDVEWVFGPECIRAAATLAEADDVLVSVVGFAGLPAVMAALGAGKRVLLANKEALVAGGALVTEAARKAEQPLLPVDSEHSAVFQCLRARDTNAPSRLILTASGGPFRTWNAKDIENATVAQALKHPNWSMGRKITIDSASMMNKALEIIEARWLFDMPPERINVVVHPQSVIHSMIEFEDGAVLAQLGRPDMRGPIGYAMGYPERLPYGAEPLDFAALSKLDFAAPDMERFPGLALARAALEEGGSAPVILNGANEAAVAAFLEERIPFGRIAEIIAETMNACPRFAIDEIGDVHAADAQARAVAAEIIGRTSL